MKRSQYSFLEQFLLYNNSTVRLISIPNFNSLVNLQVGNTALHFAAAENHPHTCHELLNCKPNIFQTNEYDETAYSLAVENNASLAQAVIENHVVALLTS